MTSVISMKNKSSCDVFCFRVFFLHLGIKVQKLIVHSFLITNVHCTVATEAADRQAIQKTRRKIKKKKVFIRGFHPRPMAGEADLKFDHVTRRMEVFGSEFPFDFSYIFF